MTKLELLKSYTPARMRDSWAASGSQEVTTASKVFTKDQIYLIDFAGSSIDGCLIFCQEDIFGIQDWINAKIIDYTYGELSFRTDIVSPNFALLLTADEFNNIAEPLDPDFIPYTELVTSSAVKIPDTELAIIMSDLGAPFIQMDELEYTRAQIADIMIAPALQEYFKWFPKVQIEVYDSNTANLIEHEFPTGAYDVVHVGVTQGSGGNIHNTLLRYFDEVVWTAQSPVLGQGGGSRTPRSQTQDWGSMMMDRAVRQGMINYGTRIHHQVIRKADGKKYLSVYSNKAGKLQVHYAIQSLDWHDVEFARVPELRELCRANILRAFGALRSQAKADIPGAVDYSEWLTRSETLRERVLADWKALVKYSGILRGSM